MINQTLFEIIYDHTNCEEIFFSTVSTVIGLALFGVDYQVTCGYGFLFDESTIPASNDLAYFGQFFI